MSNPIFNSIMRNRRMAYDKDLRDEYEKVKNDPAKKDTCVSYGKKSILYAILMLVFVLPLVIVSAVIMNLDKVGAGIVVLIIFLYLLCIVVSIYIPVIFAVYGFKYSIWQRKLNNQKIGNISLIVMISCLVVAVVLIVLSFLVF